MREAALDEAELIRRLRAAGCVFAEDEAALLLAAAGSPAELDAMVGRRVSGLPLEHVIGYTDLCGVRVAVDPGVFVPRHRSELLARSAAAVARRGDVVVDLCCGSGALGAVVASLTGGVELHATDIDPAAVRCAERNVAPYGGRTYTGDLFSALPDRLRGHVDVIVTNVPYVPASEVDLLPREARLYESRVALDGGSDGLDVLRRVAVEAPSWLRRGGRLLVETSEAQTPEAVAVMRGAGWSAEVVADPDLEATVVIATAP